MPDAASTGRRRVYCSPVCRKRAYEKRRARKPDATRVEVVERVVVETVETRHTVNERHDIVQCVARVAESPRATANVLAKLTWTAASGDLLNNPRWEPALRALEHLMKAIAEPRRR